MRSVRPAAMAAVLLLTGAAFTATIGTAAADAPSVPVDMGCLFLSSDESLEGDILDEDLPYNVAEDVPVTLQFDSPADPTSEVEVDTQVGEGLINGSSASFTPRTLIYGMDVVTDAGIIVGGGSSEPVEVPEDFPATAAGDDLPELPSADVVLELTPLAAGRTAYLQPYVLMVDLTLEELEEADDSVVATLAYCGPDSYLMDDAPDSGFPITFSGEMQEIPAPGDQEIDIPTTPVKPGDVIDVAVSNFLPNSMVVVLECPVGEDAGCLFGEAPGDGPDIIELDALSRLTQVAADAPTFAGPASSIARSALNRAADDDNGSDGIAIVTTDENGSADLTLEVGTDPEFCGPDAPCEIVAADVIAEGYEASTDLVFAAAATPSPTEDTEPTETDPPTAPADGQSGATLPDTGSHSVPFALAGAALILVGSGLFVAARRRPQSSSFAA